MEPQTNYQYPSLKKYVYVKQHIVDSIKSGQSKVLINPNFMKPSAVHVNPHFKPNKKIHVNPNVIKPSTTVSATEIPMVAPKQIDLPSAKALPPLTTPVITSNKVVRVNSVSPSKKTVIPFVKSKYKLHNIEVPLQKQRFKIDNRISSKSNPTKVNLPLAKVTLPLTKPVITSNKVLRVHSTTRRSLKQTTKSKYKLNNAAVPLQKQRFKVDNRTSSKTNSRKVKRLVHLPNQSIHLKCNKKLIMNSLASSKGHLINGTKTRRLIRIGSERYELGTNKRSLTILKNKERVSPKTLSSSIMKGSLYVKNNIAKRLLLSQAKHKTINAVKNKLKKSNIPCPFYRKFGRCKGKESGTCIRIHNSDQISLCPKFLQGVCVNHKCLLSHKVSAEKMPTCKFYLDGLCSKDDCPYLHVKINSKAEICMDFLRGFCKDGAECDKRHQYLCPDFELKGKCEKKKCPYPHKTEVRNTTVVKNIPPKLQAQTKKNFKLKLSHSTKDTPEKLLSLRYYDKSLPTTTSPEVQMQSKNADILENDDTSPVRELKKRPTVGKLPSFIPFNLSQEPK